MSYKYLMSNTLIFENTLLDKLAAGLSRAEENEGKRQRLNAERKQAWEEIYEQVVALMQPLNGFQLPGNRRLVINHEVGDPSITIEIRWYDPFHRRSALCSTAHSVITQTVAVEVLPTRQTGESFYCRCRIQTWKRYEARAPIEVAVMGKAFDGENSWHALLGYIVQEIYS